MTVRAFRLLRTLATLATLSVPAVAAAGTLDTVRQRGTLQCGVSQGLPGFSDRNAQGEWSGFDVDFCKALAAAIFDDPAKVTYVPLSAAERFDALKAGRIDVLSRNSTWTLEREAKLGLLFAGITYHDGQGFLVMRRPNITSALELTGAKICVQTGTSGEPNVVDFFRANSMQMEIKAYPTAAEALAALAGGACDVLTNDQSGLYAMRLQLPKPGDALILPDIISKEPLGPVVRNDDLVWFNAVKWVGHALVNAEELGISRATVAEALASTKPAVRRFTGAEGDLGRDLGLDNAWAIRSVRAVGNYAEVYERNVGANSRLGIPRGLNQLWTMGGILYAPPLR
ncbi:amino acid ABC transporter substrate-binding protein [Phreatobacter aquaticus]|uniref:Amino acid ABC transporter substrate-binding protein n=1 Tax=Phreatobacter aquaticus TaxID=2570229 RepID=A0A4D7Q9F0_9HYPH|nr:amino acid ABC transporter substrate-binding protein [Phreatobacter aquaticus]QCK84760.1 amino acid ABC transporter substrate-binding protein [Phreatobacter aquaticus]